MIPSSQLPVPEQMTGQPVWLTFKTRLENWVNSVAGSFRSQYLRQIIMDADTRTPPDPKAWTVPYVIEQDGDTTTGGVAINTPRAQAIADGVVLLYVPTAPGALEWTMVAGVDLNGKPATMTVVTLGAVAAHPPWFAWLIAR